MVATPQQQHTDEIYVHWSEGARLLNLKRPAFFYLVRTGQIKAEPGRAPRDGRYNLADIQAIARRRQEGRQRKPYKQRPAPVLLDWLAPEDIPAILRLDQLVFNELDLASAQRYMEWSEKNPQLAMCAFNPKSNRQEMLAYVAALPLDESVILQIMRDERPETSITKEEIQSYDAPGAYTLLANSAVCLPEHPDLLYRVLARMIEAWVERYPERFVTRIYAQSWSERGDQLIQHFFMSPRYDLASNAFMLDLARPGSARMIQRFQRALAQKAPLPEELTVPYAPALLSSSPQPPRQLQPQERHTQPRREASEKQEDIIWLTPDLVAWRSFARAHGIHENTVGKAIKSGRLPSVAGEWHIGRTIYREALDAAGRAAFWQQYHEHRSFTPCSACPHE